MKDKFQSFEDGMRMAGGPIQHPLSIHSASIGTCRRHRVWQVLMTLVFLFTLTIGQMWATDVELKPTAGEYTKGIPHKDGSLYFTRAGGKTKKVTISSKDYICPNECGFVFTLTEESEIKIKTLRASGTSTCSALNVIAASSMLETLYAAANTNNKTLSAELITWASETGDKKDYYDDLGISASSDANNKILTGQTANAKFPAAKDVNDQTYSKPTSLGTATTSLGTYAAGTYLIYFGFGDSSLGLESIILVPSGGSSTEAPTITDPTEDQSASYTVGDAITALSVTATGTPTPTYQWYYNSSASTEGATSLGSSAQLASYTPSNAAASDLYYYCVVTNSAGSATSHYFHVTVSAPSTPTHAITYNETSLKGQSVSGYPTTYYEGTGIASFDPLDDVTDWHFNGWDPASISDTEDQDVEVFATWVAAYNVTFSAGAGSGTVPASFQKWEGATFELPGQGSMVAPAGKAFDGWKANGTGAKLAANAEYTMGNAAVEFVAQWKAVPQTIYSLTVTNTSSVNLNNGGAQNDLADDATIVGGGAYMQNDHASKEQQILASTKLQFKAGTVTLVMTLNTALQEGDTIKATGLNSEGLCFGVTFDREGSLDNQLASDASYFIVPEGFEGKTTLYAWRHSGSGTTCASIIIRRPAERPVASTVITLSDVKVNDASISAANLATLVADHTLTLSDEFAAAPEIKFNEHTVITYDDELLPATKVTDKVYTVTATVNGDGKWQAQQTINSVAYTVTAEKVSSAKVYYYDGAAKLGEEVVAIGDAPADYADFQGKDYATFVGWYNNSDLAEEHKIADIAALAVTKDTTLYGKWTPAYATSINIEQWVLDNGTTNSTFRNELLARHYKYANLNNLDSLNDDPSKNYRNYAYLGQKVNKTDSEISFLLKNGSTLKVRFGHLGSNINVIYGTDDPIALTSAEYANESPAGDKVYEYTATADVIVKFQCNGTSTSVFKQIMIDEPIATVVLPAIVTLNPNGGKYDDKTENTIVKYTGTPLVLGDATPADADHVFAGWYDGEDQINAAAYVPTANVELLAHYSNTKYTVTYVGGEGATGSMDPVQVAWDAEYTLATNAFAKEGHVWSGWVATYNDGVEEQTLTITEGKITMPKYNVTVTAQWEDNSKVARIVETDVKYESFAEAYTAATVGQTIQLLQNIELSGAMFSITKNLTVDLNGKVWSHSNPSAKMIEVVEGATLTINGTAANSEFIGRINLGKAGNSNGSLVIDGGYYHCGNAQTVLHINGECMNSNVTIENATFVSPTDNAIQLNGKGTFTLTNSSFTGATGIYIKAGTLNITNCTVTGNRTPADYEYYGNGANATGDGIVVDACNYPGGAPTINIISGTFEGTKSAIGYYHPSGDPAVGGIQGGTFSSRVPNELCAPGMVPSSADPVTGKYSVEPKDGVEIIRMDITAGSSAATVVGSGLYYKATPVNIDKSAKIKNAGQYIGFVLQDGKTFAAGDKLFVTTSTAADRGYIQYFASVDAETPLKATTYRNEAATGIDLPAEVAGLQEFYIKRTTSDGDGSWNPTITAAYVTRPLKPVLKSITIDGTKIDVTGTAVAATLPYSTDLTAVTPEIVWNGAAAENSILINGSASGVFAWDENTYKLTDKDGDYTVYTITLTRAERSHDATLSDIKLDGVSLEGFDPATLSYDVELEKGTSAYPTVTYTAAAFATVTPSSDEFPGAYKLVVLAEDEETTKTYTINFTVSTKFNVVIFDGKAATQAEALKESPDATTGASWDLVGLSVSSSAFAGYNYKIATGGSTGTSKHIAVTIPANYLPQFVITHVTNSDGSARNAMVGASTSKPTTETALFYVTNSDQANPSTGTSAQLNEETTYYLHSDNSINFLKIALLLDPIMPKCEAPVLSGLADMNVCALGDALTVTASTSDGGTFAYQWYKKGETDTEVGTNSSSYVPEAAGQYYVVVTHSLAEHRDNVTTSDVVTVSVKAATEITAYNNAAGVVDANKTMSVTAVGTALTYQWQACDENGNVTDPAVLGTDATYAVTITAEPQYYLVTVSGDCGEVTQVLYAKVWSEVELQDVTGSMTWNLHKTQNPDAWGDITSDITVAATTVMANVDNGAIPNNANFRSDMLKLIVGDVQTKIRKGTDNGVIQGNGIMFHTTVPGIVIVSYRGTGNSTDVTLTIGSETLDTYHGAMTDSRKVFVPAGDVVISSGSDAFRIQKIQFIAEADYTRPVTEGRYGTICLPNGGVMVDATLYEVAYFGNTSKKIFFDEIINGAMEAGVPYIFLPKEGATELKVFYTDEADAPAGSKNGLIGTYVDLYSTDGELSPLWNKYLLSNNTYVKVTGHNCHLSPNRSYIDLDAITPVEPTLAPGRRRIALGVQGEQTATGMDELNASEAPVKMIIDGKMYILRGEKLYDATGRLVK